MARTTVDAVKALMLPGKDYDVANAPSVQPYIDTAYAIVNRVVECSTARGIILTSEELELIERWLSAHYYCMSDSPYSARSTQGASGTFQGQTGMGVEATKYGQVAEGIDYSGCLSALLRGQFLRLAWLGKAPSAQIHVKDRD